MNQIKEQWFFIGDIPLLVPKRNIIKRMQVELIFVDKKKPFEIKDPEGAGAMLEAIQGMRALSEQLGLDREKMKSYIV